MRVLVTGATGYLGGHVTQKLLGRGHIVHQCGSQKIRVVREVDAVVHLAWYASAGDAEPALHDWCLEQTKTLLAIVPGAKYIFPSTTSVYGPVEDVLATEKHRPSPTCAYTRAKIEAEQEIRRHEHCILRFGSMMGLGVKRTKTDLVVNSFAVDGWVRGEIQVWNPDSWKPVIHVKDAADLIVEAVEHDLVGTYNATLDCWQAKSIAERVRNITGADVTIVDSKNGNRSVRVDCTQMQKDFEFKPKMTIDQAVWEFEHFVESCGDKTIPWIEDPISHA